MEVNTSNQCVRVYFDDQVLNVQPLVVLTQDLTGVAQEATLVEGIDDIRADISGISIDTSDLAKQGSSTSATLTDTQAYALAAKTAAEGISIPTDYAKQGSDTTATNTAILSAIGNISIDTTDLAKQGTDSTATNTAILTAIGNISGGGVPSVAVDNSVTSIALDPNTLYVFTDRTADLTITLTDGDEDVVNEYHFFVEIGASLPTITFPNTITWTAVPLSLSTLTTFEISILNNSALWV